MASTFCSSMMYSPPEPRFRRVPGYCLRRAPHKCWYSPLPARLIHADFTDVVMLARWWNSPKGIVARLKHEGETFLGKVAIMCEHFGNVPFPHHLHRYAISEAVAFVSAIFVERQPIKKVLVSLGQYFGMSIREKLFDGRNGSESRFIPMLGKEVQ